VSLSHDEDDEAAERSHDAYLREQAGEVVRSDIGEDWRTWTSADARAYLATIMTEDFGVTTAVTDREGAAFLRLCRAEQDRLDAEDDDEGEGFHDLAGPIAAEEE